MAHVDHAYEAEVQLQLAEQADLGSKEETYGLKRAHVHAMLAVAQEVHQVRDKLHDILRAIHSRG